MQAGSQIKHENSAVFSNIFFTGTLVIYPSRAAFLTASSENEKDKKREMKEKKEEGKERKLQERNYKTTKYVVRKRQTVRTVAAEEADTEQERRIICSVLNESY